MDGRPEAFFLQTLADPSDQRLCIYHPPTGSEFRGSVVHVHAFAEEMNKSRRMVALQSRALAAAGYAVLQHDLLGCGDSSGDFGDARWDAWVADTMRAARWLTQRHCGPLWLWGLRAGCLIAAQAARENPDAQARLLFWQPVVRGKTMLQQFLRLRIAASMTSGASKAPIGQLRETLHAGHAVEIAGYTLASALAAGLEAATLEPPEETTDVVWLEVAARAPAALLPASAAEADVWESAGHRIDARAVVAPAFWHTVEIEDAPALIGATTRALLEAGE